MLSVGAALYTSPLFAVLCTALDRRVFDVTQSPNGLKHDTLAQRSAAQRSAVSSKCMFAAVLTLRLHEPISSTPLTTIVHIKNASPVDRVVSKTR